MVLSNHISDNVSQLYILLSVFGDKVNRRTQDVIYNLHLPMQEVSARERRLGVINHVGESISRESKSSVYHTVNPTNPTIYDICYLLRFLPVSPFP